MDSVGRLVVTVSAERYRQSVKFRIVSIGSTINVVDLDPILRTAKVTPLFITDD
jgi:hypothetical protein